MRLGGAGYFLAFPCFPHGRRIEGVHALLSLHRHDRPRQQAGNFNHWFTLPKSKAQAKKPIISGFPGTNTKTALQMLGGRKTVICEFLGTGMISVMPVSLL